MFYLYTFKMSNPFIQFSSHKGLPVYHHCPHETLRMKLAETQSHILLPIDWVALDTRGNKLEAKSNFEPVDNKIKISWNGNGRAGHQLVIFEAEDERGLVATCQFEILLEG